MSAEQFESWWSKDGQFARSGGGGYEKTFARNAWNAALAAAPATQPVAAEPLVAEPWSGLWTGCVFIGPAPKGYGSWSAWAVAPKKSGASIRAQSAPEVARVPLTDEQLIRAFGLVGLSLEVEEMRRCADVIERAHGIGGIASLAEENHG